MINLEETQVGIQIGAKPDSGFDDPIGMLTDCHRRIEHFLNILCVVAGRARNRALSHEEVEAIHGALQYFRVGGQRHTADEEERCFHGSGPDQRAAPLRKFKAWKMTMRPPTAFTRLWNLSISSGFPMVRWMKSTLNSSHRTLSS
jgi:hypothetical protein